MRQFFFLFLSTYDYIFNEFHQTKVKTFLAITWDYVRAFLWNKYYTRSQDIIYLFLKDLYFWTL